MRIGVSLGLYRHYLANFGGSQSPSRSGRGRRGASSSVYLGVLCGRNDSFHHGGDGGTRREPRAWERGDLEIVPIFMDEGQLSDDADRVGGGPLCVLCALCAILPVRVVDEVFPAVFPVLAGAALPLREPGPPAPGNPHTA